VPALSAALLKQAKLPPLAMPDRLLLHKRVADSCSIHQNARKILALYREIRA
jgi:hypothetical protein